MSQLELRPFGTSIQDIEAKRFNIFIGISLGNKFLSTDLAEQYLSFALDHTRSKLLVLIADQIDIINWVIYRNFYPGEAAKKVAARGQQFEDMFRRALRRLSHRRRIRLDDKVEIVRWNVTDTPIYSSLYEAVKNEFGKNDEFRERVFYFVDAYAAKRGKTPVGGDRVRLADYILAELPILIDGVKSNGIKYDLIFYPTFRESGMSQFILDIENGRYGPFLDSLSVAISKIAMVEIPASEDLSLHAF